MQNPNWPLIDEAVSWQTGPNSTPNAPYWCSMIERTNDRVATKRGKQYELDQVRAGEYSATLTNLDGALDPQNTTSPYYPNVLPYRAYRRRAQYPATVNILGADQATAGAAVGTFGVAPLLSGALPVGVSAGVFGLTAAGGVYSMPIPASPATPTLLMSVSGWSVAAGVTYSAQAATSATGNTYSVRLDIVWVNSSGGVVSASSGSPVTAGGGGGVVASASGVAPAAACGGYVQLVLLSSPATAGTVSASSLQVQRGSLTAYVQPNLWYPIFTGYVERWPQTWSRNGTYGTTAITAVDAFGYLSQRKLLSPAYMELLALGPSFLYPLDEPAGASRFSDLTGNRPQMATLTIGAATPLTAGNQLTTTGPATTGYFGIVAGAPGYLPAGIGGPVVTFTDVNAGASGPGQGLDLGSTGVIGPPTGTGWTMVGALRTTITATRSGGGTVWTGGAISPSGAGGAFAFEVSLGGQLLFQLVGGISPSFVLFGTGMMGTVNDGAWHLFGATLSADGLTCTCYLDGNAPVVFTSTTDMHPACNYPGGIEVLGINITGSRGFTNTDYSGDLALISEMPYALTGSQWTSLYNTFRFGGSLKPATPNETTRMTSGTRYADVLRWAGWAGPASIADFTTGQTRDYGAAAELLASADQQGTDTVTGLQQVVDTEAGNHYVSAGGVPTFLARRDRYNRNTPAAVFGERVDLGEIPYTVASFGYDPTRLANDIAITQTVGAIATRSIDSGSINTYGDVQLQRTVNTTNGNEIRDVGAFLLNRLKTPSQRLETITIDVGANPAAWQAMLALELGSRVRVMRRPVAAPAITFDGFVEEVDWSFDDRAGATISMQISSASGLAAWEVGSQRMTLATAVAANATSFTVNALSDAAVNPIQANISPADTSTSWVIDFGLPTAEAFTVNSVTANAPGYTTATLGAGGGTSLSGAGTSTGFAYAHSAGALIQGIGLTVASSIPALVAKITPFLSPANTLDQFASLDSTTIVAY